jgi:uncharacterized protein YkwD
MPARKPTALVLVAACAALAPALGAPRTAAAATRCSHASQGPTTAKLDQARAATLCLLNRERARRGLRALRENARLRSAAVGHSRDMADRDYFAHDTPGGLSVVDRVRKTGYLRRAHAWSVGENIAWGSGHYATPREIVDMWMHSEAHRANILDGGFREIGIGIAAALPVAGHGAGRGATYTTDFGARR